jgi:perosamine synthetase
VSRVDPAAAVAADAGIGEDVAAGLYSAGIDSAVYYPVPTHRLPAHDLDAELPEVEHAAKELLSLPIRPGLTDHEVARVVAAVHEVAHG